MDDLFWMDLKIDGFCVFFFVVVGGDEHNINSYQEHA